MPKLEALYKEGVIVGMSYNGKKYYIDPNKDRTSEQRRINQEIYKDNPEGSSTDFLAYLKNAKAKNIQTAKRDVTDSKIYILNTADNRLLGVRYLGKDYYLDKTISNQEEAMKKLLEDLKQDNSEFDEELMRQDKENLVEAITLGEESKKIPDSSTKEEIVKPEETQNKATANEILRSMRSGIDSRLARTTNSKQTLQEIKESLKSRIKNLKINFNKKLAGRIVLISLGLASVTGLGYLANSLVNNTNNNRIEQSSDDDEYSSFYDSSKLNTGKPYDSSKEDESSEEISSYETSSSENSSSLENSVIDSSNTMSSQESSKENSSILNSSSEESSRYESSYEESSRPNSSPEESSKPDSSYEESSRPNSSIEESSRPDSSHEESSKPNSSIEESSKPDSSIEESSKPDSSHEESSYESISQAEAINLAKADGAFAKQATLNDLNAGRPAQTVNAYAQQIEELTQDFMVKYGPTYVDVYRQSLMDSITSNILAAMQEYEASKHQASIDNSSNQDSSQAESVYNEAAANNAYKEGLNKILSGYGDFNITFYNRLNNNENFSVSEYYGSLNNLVQEYVAQNGSLYQDSYLNGLRDGLNRVYEQAYTEVAQEQAQETVTPTESYQSVSSIYNEQNGNSISESYDNNDSLNSLQDSSPSDDSSIESLDESSIHTIGTGYGR